MREMFRFRRRIRRDVIYQSSINMRKRRKKLNKRTLSCNNVKSMHK